MKLLHRMFDVIILATIEFNLTVFSDCSHVTGDVTRHVTFS